MASSRLQEKGSKTEDMFTIVVQAALGSTFGFATLVCGSYKYMRLFYPSRVPNIVTPQCSAVQCLAATDILAFRS